MIKIIFTQPRLNYLCYFFGRNHPHDQQLISNERKTEATMPCDLVGLKHFFLV